MTAFEPSNLPRVRNRVETALHDRIVILDTSFAMQSGFPQFLKAHEDTFSRSPLRVPTLVRRELEKWSRDSDSRKANLAIMATTALATYLDSGRAIEKHESCDRFTDHVLLRVVQQHMLDKRLLVLTNDTNLMKDLRQIKSAASVRYRGSVEVVRLCHKTGQPKFFRHFPQESSGDSRSKSISTETCSNDSASQAPRRHRTSRPNGVRYVPFQVPANPISTPAETLVVQEADPTRASLLTADGQPLQLDEKIAQGGEGVVYTLKDSSQVCKLYFPEKLTTHRRDKLRLMLTRPIQHPHICWPQEEVVDSNGEFRGYLMNKAAGVPLSNSLFIPAIFQKTHPRWSRQESCQLALGLVSTVHFLHRLNVILGDINPSNILLGSEPGSFMIVDCDSFQIEDFPCPVGTVNFTPPELQNQAYDSFLRSVEHELYAVATLLFMILLPGKPPYSHRGGGEGAENILRGEFPYTSDWSNNACSAPQGCWMFAWSHLDRGMKQMFTAVFDSRYTDQPRPTLLGWKRRLETYLHELNCFGRHFPADKPEIGYDLSILPKNKRYRDGDVLPRDGKTGLDRLTHRMYVMQANHNVAGHHNRQPKYLTPSATNPISATSLTGGCTSGSPRQPTTGPVPRQPPTVKPPGVRGAFAANTAGTHRPGAASPSETFDPTATRRALDTIYQQRGTTASICGLLLGAFCLIIVSLWGWWGSVIAVLGLPLIGWGCSRQLNEQQYYSLPGSRFANGDHRCIHCNRRGKGSTGIYVYKPAQETQRVHQCTGCREPLFYS